MTGSERGGAPRKNPHAATRVYEGEAFIVVPQRQQYKILNEVGSRVWDLIDGTRTVEEIAEIIAKEYEVADERAAGDVTEFLKDLEANGMLAAEDAKTS